jgi:Fe-S cluster assembly protein SufD
MVRRNIRSNQKALVVVGDQAETFRITAEADSYGIVLIPMNSSGDRRVDVELSGRNSVVNVIGLALLDHDSICTLTTLQHHRAPNTSSDLLVRSVLSDRSQFRYHGSIVVDKNAQLTDAYQRNENLLLSDTTVAETEPVLEILADDVRCTHGATVSTVSPEEIWYLASRGIDDAEARTLIVRGFIDSLFQQISDESLKDRSRRSMAAALGIG